MKYNKWYNDNKLSIDYLYNLFITKFDIITQSDLLYTRFCEFIYIHSIPGKFNALDNIIKEDYILTIFAGDITDLHIQMREYCEYLYQNARSAHELYKFLINYTDIAEAYENEINPKLSDDEDSNLFT